MTQAGNGKAINVFGSVDRKDYTVIGDTVNFASRLCGAAKAGEVIVSETTFRATKGAIIGHGMFICCPVPYIMEVNLDLTSLSGLSNLTSLSWQNEKKTGKIVESVIDQISTLIQHDILHVDLHPGNVVVDGSGKLVGLISLDDVLMLLAEEFKDIGQLLERETPRAVAEPVA